jgi:hypothetical protein
MPRSEDGSDVVQQGALRFPQPRGRASQRARTAFATALPCLAAALLTAGCGQTGDKAQVKTVATQFSAAIAHHDGEAACGQLSSDTVAELESQERAPCAKAIDQLGLRPAAVQRVRIFITNAEVQLDDGESAYLDRGPDGWQLSAVGCTFEEGKPHDRPARCEVQS